jgi:hypothetical protein
LDIVDYAAEAFPFVWVACMLDRPQLLLYTGYFKLVWFICI